MHRHLGYLCSLVQLVFAKRLMMYHVVQLRVGESESRSVTGDSAAPWTIQSMEFSWAEYCRGHPFPSPGHLPNPGIEPRSPTLQADSLPAEPQGSPRILGGQPVPSPGDLPDSGIELGSPALQADSLPLSYEVGEMSIQIAGEAKWTSMWQATQSLLMRFQSPQLQCTFRKSSLAEFWCDVRGEYPYSSENLLQYSPHYIHMCKTGFSPYTYFKQKYIITMI